MACRRGTETIARLVFFVSPIAASPAFAEEKPQKVEPKEAQAGRLDTIIVTARRRTEPLQRTPISVISLSETELESRSVTNLSSLQSFVPNLTFAASQNVGEAAGNAFIRGIGQEDFLVGAEPGIGFYIDGVYFARSTGTLINLLDVERIEVLRGPQGTLFGKNSIGGAINVVSVKPHPEREGRVSALIGNFNRAELRGVLNAPVSARLFLRVALGAIKRDGHVRRLPPPFAGEPFAPVDSGREGNDDSRAGRVQFRWLASNSLTLDLSLDGSRKRNNQAATHIDEIDPRFGVFPAINRLIREGKLPGPEISDALIPDSTLESRASASSFIRQDIWGVSATLTQGLGVNTLKGIFAYRDLKSRVRTDLDGLYFNILQSEFNERQHQFSGELQINGAIGRLDYTAGLFAFQEKARSLPKPGILQGEILYTCNCFYTAANRPLPITANSRVSSNNYAAYTQGTYRITKRLGVTLGGRYSHERKAISGDVISLDVGTLEPTDMVVSTGGNKDSWDSFTYRAGVEFQTSADAMIYASIAKGYKSGGFNARLAPNLFNLGLTPFAPETALTYEAGFRSQWLNRRLRVNATVFHTDYRDIQLRRQTFVGRQITTLIENAAKARIRGLEMEVMAKPVTGLTLNAVYGHLNPRYLDAGRVPGITLGSRFQRTPSHSFSIGANYRMPIARNVLELHVDYSFRSKEQFQITPSPYDQPGYGLLGARLTLRSSDDRWSVALFSTNLIDERYRSAGRGTMIPQVGIAASIVGLPRQVGLQVATEF